MNKVLKYILLLSAIVFIIACNKNSIDDTNTIDLTPTDPVSSKEDFFPIKLDIQKKFIYRYYSYSGAGDYEIKGIASWDVKSSYKVGDTTIYKFVETLPCTKTTTAPGVGSISKTDTVITNFTISEDNSHIIKLNLPFFGNISFNRYFDSNGEVVRVITENQIIISIKKNYGLTNVYYFGHRWKMTYDLIQ